MEAKDALTGAAVAVLLAVLGFIILVGVILVMMWMQPGIEHSPSEASRLSAPQGITNSIPEWTLRKGSEPAVELPKLLEI